MFIITLIICIINSAALVWLFLNQRRLRRDFAIVEQLLTPFMKWVRSVQDGTADMKRIKREKAEAVARQQELNDD